MPVTLPTPDELKQIAGEMGLSLTERDVASFIALMQPNVDAYNVVDQLPDDLPQVKYPRTAGYRPSPEENAHNAWYWKARVEGASEGKLKGRTVVSRTT
jgi:amidase